MYEVFEHTADLGLRVRADNLNELFADAGRGLFAIIAGDLSGVAARQAAQVELAGEELDYLLFDWLNELLYLFESRRLLLVQFALDVTEQGLRATVAGEPWDPQQRRLEHEVKAITYHGLRVEQQASGWLAELILDI
ncbi:MAG: archease [Planctomycetaceae bacterium]|nr:archease [Planctomycetaceae bacterium]